MLIGGFGGPSTLSHAHPDPGQEVRLSLDNRGAGATEYNGPFRGQDMVDDVAALLDHLSVYRAHILGWSMGGHIAQEFAIQNPDRTQSLTLVSAYMRRPARSSYFMNGIVKAASEGADTDYIGMIYQRLRFTTEYRSEGIRSSISVPKNVR